MTLIVTYRLVGVIRFPFYCRTIHKNYRVSSALFVAIFQGLTEIFIRSAIKGQRAYFVIYIHLMSLRPPQMNQELLLPTVNVEMETEWVPLKYEQQKLKG